MKLALGLRTMRQVSSGPPPITMVNQAGTTAVDQGANGWLITKTGGADATWGDASATSVESFAGDFILRITPQQSGSGTDGQGMVGVTADPVASNHFNTIDYAFYFNGSSQVDALYENGVSAAITAVNFVSGTHFFIKRTGTAMSFGHGGTDGITGYTESISRTSGATLFVDSSIFDSNAAWRIKRLA